MVLVTRNAFSRNSFILFQVRRIHSDGGFGSQGYGTEWKFEEAEKNVLRTHTTAVSARMLYKLVEGGKKDFEPVKYFSIDKVNSHFVFKVRNEYK